MLINYFQDTASESQLHLTIARILLGLYGLWKLVAYNWTGLRAWPDSLVTAFSSQHLLPYPFLFESIPVIVGICGIALFLFTVGIQTRYTGFVASFLVAVLAGSHPAVSAYRILSTYAVLLLLFAVFYREGGRSRSLRWTLVYFAATYFYVAYTRIQTGAIVQWLEPGAFGRTIETLAANGPTADPLVQIVTQSNLLGILAFTGVMVLELGFLVIVLLQKDITYLSISLISLHIMIGLTISHWFLSHFVFFSLFLDWGNIAASLQTIWQRLQR